MGDCGICMEPASTRTPCCRNYYHIKCLREWKRHCNPMACPSCRHRLGRDRRPRQDAPSLPVPQPQRQRSLHVTISFIILLIGFPILMVDYRIKIQTQINKELHGWLIDRLDHYNIFHNSMNNDIDSCVYKSRLFVMEILQRYIDDCIKWNNKKWIHKFRSVVPSTDYINKDIDHKLMNFWQEVTDSPD